LVAFISKWRLVGFSRHDPSLLSFDRESTTAPDSLLQCFAVPVLERFPDTHPKRSFLRAGLQLPVLLVANKQVPVGKSPSEDD